MLKKTEHNIKIITNLATKATLNAKINDVKGEIPSITNLTTTAALNATITPIVSNLVKKLTIAQKLMKLERKLLIMIMINILILQNLIS